MHLLHRTPRVPSLGKPTVGLTVASLLEEELDIRCLLLLCTAILLVCLPVQSLVLF